MTMYRFYGHVVDVYGDEFDARMVQLYPEDPEAEEEIWSIPISNVRHFDRDRITPNSFLEIIIMPDERFSIRPNLACWTEVEMKIARNLARDLTIRYA